MDKKIFLVLLSIFIIGIVIYFSIPFEAKFFSKESTEKVIRNLPYYVDRSGWTLVMDGNTEGQHSFSFENDQPDTVKHIIFALDEKDDAVKVIQFSKKFVNNSKRQYLRMNAKGILYSFYVDQETGDSIFQTGEYYYKYTNLKMNQRESEYYLLYKDSLSW
jgi:hypothetical protein